MKRFVTLFLFLLATQFVFGQSSVDSDVSRNTTQVSSREVLNISGDITSNNYYIPGTTMDLLFTLTLISPDEEYGDVISLTFPTGIVPTSGPDTFPGFISTPQNPSKLNPINGQTISWGTDNGYGGVVSSETGKSYSFYVTAVVDATVSGDQTVSYSVSGDEYNAAPHQFSGTLTLTQIPSTPELRTSPSGFLAKVYQLPLSQASFVPSGKVTNFGSPLTEATNLNLSVTGGYSNDVALPNPLGINETTEASFPQFTAAASGIYTFTLNASLANDADPSNNSYAKDLNIDNTYALENGDIDGSFGISSSSAGGQLGQLFTITAEDTVTSVMFALRSYKGNYGDTVSLEVRSFDTIPGGLLGVSLPIRITEDTVYNGELLSPVVLTPGTYYVGLVEGLHNMRLRHCNVPFVPGSTWGYFNNEWNDMGESGFKYTYIIRPTFDDVVWRADDIRLNSTSVGGNVPEGNMDISGTITNISNTGKALTSFDVQYTVDGTASPVYSVTGISLAPGETYDFTHDTPYMAVAGKHNISVTVSNPNGNVDARQDDNTVTNSTKVVKAVYSKVVVGEEATGTWCGWCVRGHVALKDMEHYHDDGSWIGIAVHNDDPMTNEEYDARIGDYISGYPSGLLNRINTEVNPAKFEDGYDTVKNILPYAKIDISSANYTVETRQITVDVASTFALDLAESNTRVSLIVVEDSITGTGDGYAQANYYSLKDINIIDWEGINWKTLGNPIPAANMVYNHVGRYIVGGFDGVAGSVPSAVTFNNPLNYQFTTTLPAAYNENNVHVVALLINEENGEIVNAAKADLDFVSGNTNIGDANAIQLSPNPTTGKLLINGLAGSTVTVYDALGRLVLTADMPNTTKTIDLSAMENGAYWVEVFNNHTIYSKQVILTK